MKNKIYWLIIVAVIVLAGLFAISSGDNSNINDSTDDQSPTLADIHGLEVDIKNPDRLYLPNHQGLYVQEADRVIKKQGEASDDFMSFAVNPSDENVLYASGHPRSGGNLGLIKSTDAGVTWEEVSEGLNGPVDFHTMAVDSVNGDHIYGYYSGALQRSLDGGESWGYLDNAPEQIIQLSAGNKKGQIYAATTDGLYASDDQGNSWSIVNFEGETVIALEVNPTSGQVIVNASSQGLVTSKDGGKSWEKSNFNVSDTILYIASSRSEPNKIFLITKSLEIFASSDNAQTWQPR